MKDYKRESGGKVGAFYKELDAYFNANDYSSALTFMENTLAEAVAINDLPLKVAVGNELGGMYRVNAQKNKAIDIYLMVLKSLKELGMEDTETFAITKMNAGNAYKAADMNGEALECYLTANKLFDELGFKDVYTIAALNNNLSHVYVSLGMLEEAEKSAYKALALIKTLLPEAYSELATTYAAIAEIKTAQGKLDDGYVYFHKAISIYAEKLYGKDIHYANACFGLGNLLLMRNNRKEALKYFLKAQELVKRDFGENDNYKMIKIIVDNLSDTID